MAYETSLFLLYLDTHRHHRSALRLYLEHLLQALDRLGGKDVLGLKIKIAPQLIPCFCFTKQFRYGISNPV